MLIILCSITSPLVAESYNYSGDISRSGEGSKDDFQAELNFKGTAVTGFYVFDETERVVKLEGYNRPKERLYLKAFLNNGYWADIKLAKYITPAKKIHAYDEGSVHWVGYIFRKNGQREKFHLVETDSNKKHPVFLSKGRLPGIGPYPNISFDPETGKKIYDLDDNEIIGAGREGTPCIGNGIPWLDCKLNYHPVDGCYLTNSQRNICRRVPSFDMDDTGYVDNCWSFAKGPGLQLPFQREAKSEFNLSEVELVKGRSDDLEARSVVANRAQIASGNNFLNRPTCQSASAWGPVCLDGPMGCL
ncbi:MAG: hypothetical protein V7742_12315 [Halioglobus sp.]